MKVLVAHNLYRSSTPSGENRAVDEDIRMLRESGVDVVPMLMSSDSLSHSPRALASAAVGPVWSPQGVRMFKDLLAVHKPDLVHIHNPFPLVSPGVVRVALKAQIPVVQTVHNYRHTCVRGTHFRRGSVCVDCAALPIGWPGAVHACYRDSHAQSIAMVVGQSVNRSLWRKVSRFIALTDFMAERLRQSGIDEERIVVRPTACCGPRYVDSPGNGFLFSGRLDEAKGVPLLLDAWQRSGRSSVLTIAGDGPLRSDVLRAAKADPTIRFLGLVSSLKMEQLLRETSAVVMPSLWWEGYPRVICEAFAHGRPVVTSRVVGLASLVGTGLGWTHSAEPSDLAATLDMLTSDPVDVLRRGRLARQHWERQLSVSTSAARLIAIYEDVIRDLGRK